MFLYLKNAPENPSNISQKFFLIRHDPLDIILKKIKYRTHHTLNNNNTHSKTQYSTLFEIDYGPCRVINKRFLVISGLQRHLVAHCIQSPCQYKSTERTRTYIHPQMVGTSSHRRQQITALHRQSHANYYSSFHAHTYTHTYTQSNVYMQLSSKSALKLHACTVVSTCICLAYLHISRIALARHSSTLTKF